MRRRSILSLLALTFVGAAVFSCYSCSPVNNDLEVPGPDEQETEDPGKQDPSTTEPTGPQPGTYKFVASPMKGTWKEGDQIYVHGNIGTQAQIITLSASGISADGKTASATLDADALSSPAEPDGFYAAWPADDVYMFKGVLKTKTTFENSEVLLTQAYLKDDTFTFIDISSLVTFSVDGDYDNWAICSNNRNGICITRFESEFSSAQKKFTYKQNDGYPFRYGSIESGKAEIWFPGDFSMPDGYTIFLGKGESWTATYTVSGSKTFTSGEKTDLGNITSSLTPYDGFPPKMPKMVDSQKYTVRFNELSGVCISEDGKFIWGVGDNGDLAKLDFDGNITYSFHIGGDAEDVSINPVTHDLLIGLEPDGAGVVLAPDFNKRASTLFSLSACKNYGNAGIEGLTYYKDGLIFMGAQSNSHLFLCSLESKSVLWEAKLYDVKRVSEIAGLSYDPKSGWLWIIDSEAKKIFVFDVDHSQDGEGKYSVKMDFIGAYPVAGSNPEAVGVDRINNCVWVADDYGDTSYLYRYEFTGLDEFDK
jgi:hypothetical protein